MSPLYEILKNTITELELCVQALGDNFTPPRLVDYGGLPFFRHMQQDDLLASYLKCLIIVSSLNASLVLLEKGFVQEVHVLCRCIDEYCEDIWFLATLLNGNAPSKDQIRFVNEFFQEEYDQPDNPLISTQKRDRVPRSKIQASISRIDGQVLNPSDSKELLRTISQTFSGYVHGAYVHVMDLYGGSPPHFHTSGMVNTPRSIECEKNLVNYVYRSIKAAQVVSRRTGASSIDNRLVKLSKEFEKKTGCITDQPVEARVKQLKRDGVKKELNKKP